MTDTVILLCFRKICLSGGGGSPPKKKKKKIQKNKFIISLSCPMELIHGRLAFEPMGSVALERAANKSLAQWLTGYAGKSDARHKIMVMKMYNYQPHGREIILSGFDVLDLVKSKLCIGTAKILGLKVILIRSWVFKV